MPLYQLKYVGCQYIDLRSLSVNSDTGSDIDTILLKPTARSQRYFIKWLFLEKSPIGSIMAVLIFKKSSLIKLKKSFEDCACNFRNSVFLFKFKTWSVLLIMTLCSNYKLKSTFSFNSNNTRPKHSLTSCFYLRLYPKKERNSRAVV